MILLRRAVARVRIAATPFQGVVDGGQRDAPSSAEYIQRITAAMQRVCAIENDGAPLGTGVLVGPDLVLTNHHVLKNFFNSAAPVRGLGVRLDYTDDGEGLSAPFAVDWDVFKSPPSLLDERGATGGFTDAELDFALVRLADRVGERPVGDLSYADVDAPPRGWEMLFGSDNFPPEGDPIQILHHPGRFGFRQARMIQDPVRTSSGRILSWLDGDRRLRHDAPTEYGSSGGACFSQDWRFLALHHMADPNSEPGERGRFNQAIPISAIARRLEATGDESLLAQLRKPPPDPKRRARLAAAPAPADDRELIRLVDAAKCLLDRSDAVRDLLGSRAVDRAMVHVVVCRDVDEYTTLIRRLRQLALPVKGAAGAGVARLAGEGPGWGGARIDWPTADRDPEWAYKALAIELQRVLDDEGRRGKPTLIVAEVSRQEWSPERDLALLQRFAQLCAQQAPDDTLQALVIYYEDDAPGSGLRDDDRRDRLAKLWARNHPPERCGACLRLADVAAAELTPWSEIISQEWGIPQLRILNDVRLRLPDGRKLAMRELHSALHPDIAGYAAEHLRLREQRSR